MTTRYNPFVYFTVIIAFTAISYGNTSIPAGSDFYQLLDRLELKQVIEPQSGFRPVSRNTAAKLIQNITAGQDRYESLSGSEKAALDYWRNELAPEIARLEKKEPDFKKSWRLFNWTNGKNYCGLDYVFRQTLLYNLRSGEEEQRIIGQTSSGLTAFGYLGKYIGFSAYGVDTKERSNISYTGTRPYSRVEGQQGLGVTAGGNAIYYDRVDGYLTVDLPVVDIEFGKQTDAWGPGRFGSMILSAQSVPFDRLKLEAEYGWVRFCSIHGKLAGNIVSDTLDGYPLYHDRYFAGHRLEINLPKRVQLGFTESLIYGTRGPEWAYLNPIMFYWSAENYLHDQDNSLMAVDIKINTVRNLSLYGEFMIDDHSADSLGTGYYGNKPAFLTGLAITGPGALRDLLFECEYAMIYPWVYTHTKGVNCYTNQGVIIGHDAGPNTGTFSARLTMLLPGNGRIALYGSYQERGANYYDPSDSGYVNVGSVADSSHKPTDSIYRTYLHDGTREIRRMGGIDAVLYPFEYIPRNRFTRPFRNLQLHLGYYFLNQQNVPTESDPYTRDDYLDHYITGRIHYNFR